MINKFEVLAENSNKRLDCFLLEQNLGLTRSHIKNLIEDGKVTLSGKIVKSGEKVKLGQEVCIDIISESTQLIAEKMDINIVYEDNDLMVVNKPQGMVVHPGNGNKTGTLVNGLLYNKKELSGVNGDFRPGIVHRLDKNTSGLMVVAKNDFAHTDLSKQISSKECKRIYNAIVMGNIKEDSGIIETYIGRDKKVRTRMAVTKNGEGRKAITLFKVLERFKGYCFVEFELKTGRTHQIRVHCKYMGTPVLGDDVYGPLKQPFKTNGQILHSKTLILFQPTTKEVLTFNSELPDYFSEILDKLRRSK